MEGAASVLHGRAAQIGRAGGRTDPPEEVENYAEMEAADGVTENSEEEVEDDENEAGLKVLKMLYKGDVSQISRRQEQQRKGGIFNKGHNFYKHTRCTSIAQEEHSAFPAGVLNVCEDSDDGDDLVGEDGEIAQELRELHVVQHWVNLPGWDRAIERKVVFISIGLEVDLTLDWEEVARKIGAGAEGRRHKDVLCLEKAVVDADYALDDLDPTQRAFADRVLKWGDDLVKTYQQINKDGKPRPVPTQTPRALVGREAP